MFLYLFGKEYYKLNKPPLSSEEEELSAAGGIGEIAGSLTGADTGFLAGAFFFGAAFLAAFLTGAAFFTAFLAGAFFLGAAFFAAFFTTFLAGAFFLGAAFFYGTFFLCFSHDC